MRNTDSQMKWLLMISGLLLLLGGLSVGFLGHVEVMWVSLWAFIALSIAANLDRIEALMASKSGIEIRTRAVIARAEVTLCELQLLAQQMAQLTLSLVKRSGRIGGYSDVEEDRIRDSVLEVLKRIGIAEKELSSILAEWHRFVEFDYGHAILGGSTIPANIDDATLKDWKQLRAGGVVEIPLPVTIREFLIQHKLMSNERDEYLKDYEHYRVHRTHRRPEVWRERRLWGRLTRSNE